ncbi:hypothetical protein [Citrobacter phage Tr1]|nr:hypothetical protein [Citrobacter phage Tr1]
MTQFYAVRITIHDSSLFTGLVSGERYMMEVDEDGDGIIGQYFALMDYEIAPFLESGFHNDPGFSLEYLTMEQYDAKETKIVLTPQELITIIEDAFIDGWNTQDNDWASAEAYLEHHNEYDDECETTIALKNLMEGNNE